MSRDVAAEMRDFSQDEPTHRGMTLFWASEVEAMQRRIAELEESRLEAWDQAKADRAVIESARKKGNGHE